MRKAICMFALGIVVFGTFAARAGSQSKAASGFDLMKTLVGTWEAVSPGGTRTTNTIRVVSNNTAIEETFQSSEADQMVTLYSRDGDRIAMIHLCSLGNQPRMETPALTADSNAFDFSFTGATNLAGTDDPHMHHMLLQIVDNDHFNETWTLWSHDGKQQPETFHFTRKKS